MIWHDTIKNILDAINYSSIYNPQRSTLPANFDIFVYNQAQDWLCMYKPWRDLRVVTQLTLSSDRKITMPSDFGCTIFVYTDPANIGKPMYFYYLNHNDVTMRYTEEVAYNATTGARTIVFAFPPTVFIPQNPYVVYSKVLANATSAEKTAGTKYSFFPMTIMLVVVKKILQDYYGVPANQDPNWINKRVEEEIKMLEGYAYNNNMSLDLSIKDRFGNPVFIQSLSLDGSKPRIARPSPYLPATIFSGGTG